MGASGGGLDKAALKQTPREVMRWNIWLTVIWASYCGALHGFNTANISGAMSMSSFKRDFKFTHLSSTTISDLQGWAVSSMLLGQLVGVILSGPLGETRGRKPVILAAAIFYTIGAILMAANFGSYAELIVGRVLSGLGSGFGMTVGAIYISEVAPRALRGCMATFYNINIMMGVTASYWINYGSKLHIPASSSWQWRTTMVLQAIPAIVLFIGYPFCPESPRYLMMKGQTERAKGILSRLRNLPYDHAYFVEEFNELSTKAIVEAEQRTQLQALKELFQFCARDESTRKRLVFCFLLQTFFIMCGGNSITYYAPNILESIGLGSNQILLFTAIYGCIKVVSVFLYAFFLTDRYGRRPLLLIGATTNMLCTLYLSVFLGVANISSDAPASPAAWVAIVAICIFAIGYGFGWAPAFSLTASEICPTRTRGSIVAISFAYQNLLNFGITRGFPNMVETMHSWGPFALFTACSAVATTWVFLAFPECKGRNMENMDALFTLPWYKVGRASVKSPNSELSGENQSVKEVPEDYEADVKMEKEASIMHIENVPRG